MSRQEIVSATLGLTGIAAIAVGIGSLWGWPGALTGAGLCLFWAAVMLDRETKK